jgi:hypothetical protein
MNYGAWLHSFSLSRVSHKGEFYLDRFLMRQPLHKLPFFVICCLVFDLVLILLSTVFLAIF